MIFDFPQKKEVDIKRIKLYSSSNIQIESMMMIHNSFINRIKFTLF